MDKNVNIAGFSVSRGVCYLYNNYLAVGVDYDSRIVCRILRTKNDARLRKFPFIRALIFVIIAIKNAILGYFVSKEIVREHNKITTYNVLVTIVKYIVCILGAVYAGVLGALLLVQLPNFITISIFEALNYVVVHSLIFNIVNSTFTVIILILLTYILSRFGKKYFHLQNAVNKAMSALRNHKSLDVDVVAEEKPRYFFNPFSIVFITIILSIYALPLFYESNFWLNLIYKTVLFAIILSAVYEVFVFLNQYDNKFVRFISKPSYWIQALLHKDTDERSIMCAIVTLKEVLMMNDKDEDILEHNLIYEWQKLREEFLANNITDESDVDWIFCEVLKCNRAELKTIKYIAPKDLERVREYAELRKKGEPLQRIFGHANFYGFEFELNDETLIPRFDTEILVETVLKDIKVGASGLNVLDMCTGSGCIAITISKMTDCNVVGVDINESAIAMARINADRLNAKVLFLQSDLFSKLGEQKYDIIVSNPPYIKTSEIDTLEVSNYDPHLALDGGTDGLDFYRAIIAQAPNHLNVGGKIYFELGKGQFDEVKKFLMQDFDNIGMRLDYQGIERVIYATLKSK